MHLYVLFIFLRAKTSSKGSVASSSLETIRDTLYCLQKRVMMV
jgi:hypothetical protein